MKKIFYFTVLSLCLFVACNKEGELLSTKEGELEYVTVNIDVTASDCKPMTGVVSTSTKSLQTDDIICDAILPDMDTSTNTKSIDDPSDASLTTIKNLWVLQYDGTGNSAKLIGNPVYIEDYQNNKSAKLVASTTPNTIVFLANTFDKYIPFGQNSTIAELKERVFVTNSLETILSKDPNTQTVLGDEFPIDGDYYQRLNGYIEQAITGGTLSCTLAHNACRISLNIVNNTNGPGKANPVTLISADIENVPGCMYFFTDYSGYTSGNTVGKPQVLDGFARYGMKTYTDVITWNGTEGTDPTIIKQAKLYLSANESGVISTNESPKLKSLVAPNSATILRIYGTYNDGTADIPLKYTFALGADMTRSYQLVPNGDYVYNITLNARGDKTTDARVSYQSANGVDYTQTTIWPLSNCYICNPPAISSRSNTYRIPVSRVDQFWGGGQYEDVESNCLGTNNPWEVSVIWSDMEINANNFTITKSTGAGSDAQGDGYFEVSIPSTTEKGNVIIGIKRTGANAPSYWLWSWHLWVTDYCPDEAKYLAQQNAFIAGSDTYHIAGGDVQRYTVAGSGSVQKVYMDRSLGAMFPASSQTMKGQMYYQFGRKDPFRLNGSTYWEGGIVCKSNNNTKVNYNSTDLNQPCNVPYSVKNPTVFITSDQRSPWTMNDKYNPTPTASIIWQDPNASALGNKSIFDPCPSGWKVPVNMNGVNGNISQEIGTVRNSSTSIAAYSFYISFEGRIYGTTNDSFGSCYGIWLAYSNGRDSGTSYWYNFPNGFLGRCMGYPVRPVQE